MEPESVQIGRRAFLSAATFAIVAPQAVRGSQANSAIRVGLLGCGGRGTVVATSLMENAGARITAIGDLFEDQIPKAATHFNGLSEKRGLPRIDASQMFSGLNAPERIVNSKEVDAIVIATPPYFHPEHLDLVVGAGKHAYCEKPVAVDVPGTRRVLEIGKRAQGKLSLEVGFQIRKAPPFVELVKRIHEGAIGEILSGQAYYYCPFIDVIRPGIPARQAHLRHWMYDRALSGDIIVEQNIHAIDTANWVLQGHPVSAVGHGSRKGRPDNGNCYGNCSVTFTYPKNVILAFSSKQVGTGGFDVNDRFFGTLGNSESPYSGPLGIDGSNPWNWKSPQAPSSGEFSQSGSFSDNLAQADSEKHKSWIESIVSGQFHNQAALGVESSLTAMLGRMAMDTGREITWEELNKSREVLEAKLDLSKVI